MRKIKRMISIILSFCIIASGFCGIDVKAASFNDINNSTVFVKQQKNDTCTLASATMLVRRTALASGNSNWNSITESAMRGTEWLEGTGLYLNFTYAGISVNSALLNGGSANQSQLISLLQSHPEGVVIYDWDKPHAILITDYTNGTFYCADPANTVAAGRIPVSQASITINGADRYWYVSSPKISIIGQDTTPPTISNYKVSNLSKDGFTVSCTVKDNSSVSYVDFLVWPNANGDWSPVYQRAKISGNTASCYVKTSEHHEYEGNYAVHLEAYDTSGNMTYGQFDWIYVDKTGPGITNYKVSNKTEKGFTVSCTVKDNKKIAYVDFLVWPNANGDWSPEYHRAKISGNTASYYVKVSEHHNFYGNYAVHLQAYDSSGNMTYGQFDWINVVKKKNQTIDADSFTKTLGDKAFSLGAKTSGNGKLTYKSSNTKVATVSSSGKITIKGTGTAKITITAAESSKYKKSTKTVKVKVRPKSTTLLNLKNNKSKKLTIAWKRNSNVKGYRIQVATNSSFKNAKTYSVSGNKTLTKTISVSKGKKYYVRICTYSGGLDSKWSKASAIKIKK